MGDEDDQHDSYVTSFLNGRPVRSLRTFPSDILNCDRKIRALFKVWMLENEKIYPSPEEEERRFGGFKDRLIWVNEKNSMPNSGMMFGLNQFAARLPSDPWAGANMTQEEGLTIRHARELTGSYEDC